MNRELAAEVRRLAGTRTVREAVDAAAREFVRRRKTAADPTTADKAGDDSESVARADRQTRLLRESARAIAASGDPFHSGYDPREVREKMWRTDDSG